MNQQLSVKGRAVDDGTLEIVNVHWSMQPDGPHAGRPAVMVVLGNCNLQCNNCDVNYTAGLKRLDVSTVVRQICACPPADLTAPLVSITGGEPFRQPLGNFVMELAKCGIEDIQIETNGTLYDPTLFEDYVKNAGRYPIRTMTIMCGPKTSVVDQRLMPFVTDLKYVISAQQDAVGRDGFPNIVLGKKCKVKRPWSSFGGNVWLVPEDEHNSVYNNLNIRLVTKLCLEHGHRAGVQLNKLMGAE